jgi:hypothetical protein
VNAGDVLRRVVETLESAGITYMLEGSYASSWRWAGELGVAGELAALRRADGDQT